MRGFKGNSKMILQVGLGCLVEHRWGLSVVLGLNVSSVDPYQGLLQSAFIVLFKNILLTIKTTGKHMLFFIDRTYLTLV